jgi:hypothetical protein
MAEDCKSFRESVVGSNPTPVPLRGYTKIVKLVCIHNARS